MTLGALTADDRLLHARREVATRQRGAPVDRDRLVSPARGSSVSEKVRESDWCFAKPATSTLGLTIGPRDGDRIVEHLHEVRTAAVHLDARDRGLLGDAAREVHVPRLDERHDDRARRRVHGVQDEPHAVRRGTGAVAAHVALQRDAVLEGAAERRRRDHRRLAVLRAHALTELRALDQRLRGFTTRAAGRSTTALPPPSVASVLLISAPTAVKLTAAGAATALLAPARSASSASASRFSGPVVSAQAPAARAMRATTGRRRSRVGFAWSGQVSGSARVRERRAHRIFTIRPSEPRWFLPIVTL